uniref:Uncharacterized protein n=1 Tax=Photinus pyralis TaxID=7054 RepID=A0A1Y1MD47_PHOPY
MYHYDLNWEAIPVSNLESRQHVRLISHVYAIQLLGAITSSKYPFVAGLHVSMPEKQTEKQQQAKITDKSSPTVTDQWSQDTRCVPSAWHHAAWHPGSLL